MSLLHAAGIIIKNQKVLLIKRSNSEDSEPGKWCPVNESLEEGESPKDAVVRGVKEEIGLDYSVTNELPVWHFGDHSTYVFIGNIEGTISPNPEEVEEYGWFSYDDTKRIVFAYGYEQIIENLYQLGLII